MDLHIDEIKLQEGLLLVNASGKVELDVALRLIKQVFDTAKENGINKILVNTLTTDGELSTVERYQFGVEVAAYVKQHQMNPRLAFVGKPPTMNGFGVRVAQNRDMVANMFHTQQEAMDWLKAWPD